MHSLVRRYIKTAILFLGIGLVIGVKMIFERDVMRRVPDVYETSAHTHALLVGFVMMMILGVALWLFPRGGSEGRRYDPQLALVAYWLLTAGTALRVGGELIESSRSVAWLGWTVVVASLAQAAGIAMFFFTMWPRIRSAGSHVREAKGERF
ncbi:MAG TPA: cbb3-type cytochrome c oxidase subunit I [Gemmatimonadaceae bacterium]|nr:cbb3-type cytochrome c oxidase subunit I [Gemmatimonadaceae bacterium]